MYSVLWEQKQDLKPKELKWDSQTNIIYNL
jgi:hypothetical protein